MRIKIVLLITLVGFSVAANAIEPSKPAPIIAGSWNVIATQNSDRTCNLGKTGDVTAYIWIVNQTADGQISITVQGQTSFPKLTGVLDKKSETLVVSGFSIAKAKELPTGSWFKLKLDKQGNLVGTRRYLGSISTTQYPCFLDEDVVAKKQ